MSRNNRKWLVALVEVDGDRRILNTVPRGQGLSALPDALCEALDNLSDDGGLDLERVYILDDKGKARLLDTLEEQALDYHTEAHRLDVGPCTLQGCPVHQGNVFHVTAWGHNTPGQPN